MATGLLAIVACGSDAGGSLGEVGTFSDAGVFVMGDAVGGKPLDAYIEESGVRVELVTVRCAGACADVQAVATGGHPPYTFAWDDGSTSVTREVCPASDTDYHVDVTDTAVSGELARPAMTVRASVTADVLACPDGGPADASSTRAQDAGGPTCTSSGAPLTTGCESVSINAPIFQNCPMADPTGASFEWLTCLPQPLVAGQSYTGTITGQGVVVLGDAETWSLGFAAADCSNPQAVASVQVTASGNPSSSACVVAKESWPGLLFKNALSGSFHATTDTNITLQVCAGCTM